MYQQDDRRKWLQEMPPSVLGRVSRLPAGKRRTWLARGDVKAAHKSRRAQLLDAATAPQRMKMEYMRRQMPLSDREKMEAQFLQAQQMQQGSQAFTAGQGDIEYERRKYLTDLAYGNKQREADRLYNRSRQDVIADREYERQARLEDVPKLRAPIPVRTPEGDTSWATPGVTPLPKGATGMPTYKEPEEEKIPSIAEQEAMILNQYMPGSPEWIEARRQIEEIKRAPVDPVQQALALQRLYRGTLEEGPAGQIMGTRMPEQEAVANFALKGLNETLKNPVPGGRSDYTSFAGLPEPQSEEEIIDLPVGTKFRAPDGSIRIR